MAEETPRSTLFPYTTLFRTAINISMICTYCVSTNNHSLKNRMRVTLKNSDGWPDPIRQGPDADSGQCRSDCRLAAGRAGRRADGAAPRLFRSMPAVAAVLRLAVPQCQRVWRRLPDVRHLGRRNHRGVLRLAAR